MSSEKDLRASFNTFIQDLPQLVAEKDLEQVYDLYKANGYDSFNHRGTAPKPSGPSGRGHDPLAQ